ncbi:hypothetical protein Tco_0000975 [Tanacetum coccineum]
MLAWMTPELQKELGNHTVFDMINKLISMFQTQSRQELYDTQSQLNACNMEEGQSVSSRVLKMKSYINKMECLGHPMPLVLMVNTIIRSSKILEKGAMVLHMRKENQAEVEAI